MQMLTTRQPYKGTNPHGERTVHLKRACGEGDDPLLHFTYIHVLEIPLIWLAGLKVRI